MDNKKEDKRIYILREEKPAKAVVKLGVPLIAGMFIMVLYNLVDTYFIGLMRDDYQLAAVNLAYPVMMIMVAISNMIGTGASSLIARSLGAGDKEKADHTVTVGFGLTVLNSLIVAAVGLLLLPAIVKGLGAQSNTFEYTKQYVQVILAGSLLTMGNYTKYIRPTAEILREIFWVGVPATLETLLTSTAYIVNNNLAVGYGELTVAAMGIAQKILSLGNYVYQGFAAGTQPIMGYNYGAKNYRRMRDVLKAGIMVCSGTELCIMAVYGIFAPQLIGIFTQSPEVIATGSRVLRTIMWILPFVGAVSMSRMSFQAMGKPQYAFAITLVRQLFLYVPLLLILNRLFGFGGMIWAQPCTEVIMMAVSVGLLYRVINENEAENGQL